MSEQTNTEDVEVTTGTLAQPAIEAPARRPSGFHPVNIWHLVMGVLFGVFVAGWIVLINQPADDWSDLRWMFPLPWIAAGGIGLTVAAIRSIRRHR